MGSEKDLRFGNFRMEMSAGRLTVSAVSGVWSESFGMGGVPCVLFPLLVSSGDDKLVEFLECWVKLCYAVSSSVPDLRFMDDVMRAYDGLVSRMGPLSVKGADEGVDMTIAKAMHVLDEAEAIDGGSGVEADEA